jgi:hypothetical protein
VTVSSTNHMEDRVSFDMRYSTPEGVSDVVRGQCSEIVRVGTYYKVYCTNQSTVKVVLRAVEDICRTLLVLRLSSL